jgi:signal transduction histidine kinase
VRTPVESGLMVRYDANRLQQILLNLINNALKFTPRGGSVTLSVHREKDAAAFEVTDTGCGIPPEQLQRVFEPFVQLHTTIESADKPGVGLGLAICQELAFAMGGRISVRSSVGLGSTFSVMLPLGPSAAPGAPSAQGIAPPNALQ